MWPFQFAAVAAEIYFFIISWLTKFVAIMYMQANFCIIMNNMVLMIFNIANRSFKTCAVIIVVFSYQ
jgi:hypothetical protein